MESEFRQLIEINNNLIFKVCRMYSSNQADSEDLYQDILLQLWKSFPSFRSEAKVSTWIYRIAINTSITQFRKTKNRPVHEAISDQLTKTLGNTPIGKEEAEHLNRAINLLSEVEKGIILLYMDDYTYREISDIIGLTESNIGFKINQIKKKLKAILTK